MKNNERNEEEFIEKLNNIKGQSLTYKKMCELLDEPLRNSDSKKRQIEEWQLFCNIDISKNPTRYVVLDVYEGRIELLKEINSNNKYQTIFEGGLYQRLLDNKGKPLYISNMELLSLFHEVNENFSYSCNTGYMSLLGVNYQTLNEMSQIVYKILKRWTSRRMEQMEKRKVIIVRKGFRLYSKTKGGAIIITNVEPNTQTEKICQEIYDKASIEIMPDKWAGEWVTAWRWERFEEKIKELVIQYFEGEYIDMRSINIISPPREEYLIKKLNDIYGEVPELNKINEETCRKLLTTKQLDKYTGEERQNLIDLTIKQNPEISLRDKIKKKKKEWK